MSLNYDNWERLVTAVMLREHDRELALAPSLDSTPFSSFRSSVSQLDVDPAYFTLPINFSELSFLRTAWKAFLSLDVHRSAAMDGMVDLQEITERMIQSGYEKECFQVCCTVIVKALEEHVAILGLEKLNVEDVQRVEYWPTLDGKMKKWVQAIKQVIRGLHSSEKYLCEHIFSGSDLVKEVCFLETAKDCVMQLLNFGGVVAIGSRSGEKLFRILDMYDALAQGLPDLQALFMGENGDMVCSEAKKVLDALGEAAVKIIIEFENEVQKEPSSKPIKNGGIHPLSRYVVNYVKLLVDYTETFNLVLENVNIEPTIAERENTDGLDAETMSPFAKIVSALAASLQSNIEKKSRVYEDVGMQNIFLMNNMLYVLQKVEDSELRNLLGDNWVRKRLEMIQQCATQYLRASWIKVLDCLRGEGILLSPRAVYERFLSFNAYFEDVYRTQTAWTIPNPQLREELRISISEKLILGYRTFMGKYYNRTKTDGLMRKYTKCIKHTPEDLENYLLDLFEGTPRVLHLK